MMNEKKLARIREELTLYSSINVFRDVSGSTYRPHSFGTCVTIFFDPRSLGCGQEIATHGNHFIPPAF